MPLTRWALLCVLACNHQLLREEEDHISQQQLGGHGSEMMGIYDALEGSLGGACMSTIPESGFCGNGLLAKFELGTETP
jgi:hypothetical protein